jgi:hypothetical protein
LTVPDHGQTCAPLEYLATLLCSESTTGYRRSGLLLIVIFVLLGAALCVSGAPPLGGGPWDMSLLLDGGWRIVSGQVPHSDFHSPLGPLTYILVALGMKLSGLSADSVTYGSVLMAAILLPCAWYIASRRLSWVLSFTFVMIEGFLMLTPRPLGYGIRETTYAMIYNRQGYAIIAMLAVCLLLKGFQRHEERQWIDGALSGLLLGLLLYLKITYFAAGIGFVLLAVAFYRPSIRWLLSCVAVFAAVCAGFFFVFHVGLHAYLTDFASAMPAQSPGERMESLTSAIKADAAEIYLLAFCICIWTWLPGRGDVERPSMIRIWVVAGFIVGAALFLDTGNAAQRGADPMYLIGALIPLELLRRQSANGMKPAKSNRGWAYAASWLLVFPTMCGVLFAQDLASCAYVVAWSAFERPKLAASQHIHSANLRDFNVPTANMHITDYWPVNEFPQRINDGIALLSDASRTNDRIVTIDYANPFSFALGTQPARDSLLWWNLHYSFDREHAPTAQEFLGDASLAMAPRLTDRRFGCCFETPDLMMELYGDYLYSHFHEVASNDSWTLYRRNAGE